MLMFVLMTLSPCQSLRRRAESAKRDSGDSEFDTEAEIFRERDVETETQSVLQDIAKLSSKFESVALRDAYGREVSSQQRVDMFKAHQLQSEANQTLFVIFSFDDGKALTVASSTRTLGPPRWATLSTVPRCPPCRRFSCQMDPRHLLGKISFILKKSSKDGILQKIFQLDRRSSSRVPAQPQPLLGLRPRVPGPRPPRSGPAAVRGLPRVLLHRHRGAQPGHAKKGRSQHRPRYSCRNVIFDIYRAINHLECGCNICIGLFFKLKF